MVNMTHTQTHTHAHAHTRTRTHTHTHTHTHTGRRKRSLAALSCVSDTEDESSPSTSSSSEDTTGELHSQNETSSSEEEEGWRSGTKSPVEESAESPAEQSLEQHAEQPPEQPADLAADLPPDLPADLPAVGDNADVDFSMDELRPAGVVLAWGGTMDGVGAVFLGVVDSIETTLGGSVSSVRGQYLQPQTKGTPVGLWVRSLSAKTMRPWGFTVVNKHPRRKPAKDVILATDVMAIVDWRVGGVLVQGQQWTEEATMTASEWEELEHSLEDMYGE